MLESAIKTAKTPKDITISSGRKHREFVTRETCLAWLVRAKKETEENGFFQPGTWQTSPGRNIKPTVSVKMGLTRRVSVHERGVTLPACKQWIDPNQIPTIELSEKFLVAYKEYNREHGNAKALPDLELPDPEKAKPEESPTQKELSPLVVLPSVPVDMTTKTQSDRIEHALLDMNLKLDRMIKMWS